MAKSWNDVYWRYVRNGSDQSFAAHAADIWEEKHQPELYAAKRVKKEKPKVTTNNEKWHVKITGDKFNDSWHHYRIVTDTGRIIADELNEEDANYIVGLHNAGATAAALAAANRALARLLAKALEYVGRYAGLTDGDRQSGELCREIDAALAAHANTQTAGGGR